MCTGGKKKEGGIIMIQGSFLLRKKPRKWKTDKLILKLQKFTFQVFTFNFPVFAFHCRNSTQTLHKDITGINYTFIKKKGGGEINLPPF